MAILKLIPEGDLDLTTFLEERLRTNKPEQHNNLFWFSKPENPGKTENYTRIQTRVLKLFHELKQKEKVNPRDDTNSGTNFLKPFDWTNTLLTGAQKQAVEHFFIEYQDNFVTCRMDKELNN